jgi:L-lactate dehydrogenase complex protein LldG
MLRVRHDDMAGSQAMTNATDAAIEQFVRAATAAAASVTRVPRNAHAITAAVAQITAGCRTMVIAQVSCLEAGLTAGLRDLPGVLGDASDEQLATADAGITGAFAGIASTGSICVEVGASLTPAASLLMPLHVALLPVERILQRPRVLFADHAGNPAGNQNFVFITGPSATADMGPLVRGVHGPHRLHILLVEL